MSMKMFKIKNLDVAPIVGDALTPEKKKEKLEFLVKKIQWENAKDRIKFLRNLDPVIINWLLDLPDLNNFMSVENVKTLLEDSVKKRYGSLFNMNGKFFISFVSRCGYKITPNTDQVGNPILLKTTLVHEAGEKKFYSLIEDLLLIYDNYNYTNETATTHFEIACKADCVLAVKNFLRNESPDTTSIESGDSLLHMNLNERHLDVSLLLIKNGADPSVVNNQGFTPLHVIAHDRVNGHVRAKRFIEAVLSVGKEINLDAKDKSGQTPILLALKKNNPKFIETLFRYGSDINIKDQDSIPALHIMCMKNNMFLETEGINILKTIFEIDQDKSSIEIEARNENLNTVLHTSVIASNVEALQILIENKADVNAVNKMGSTVLHLIAEHKVNRRMADAFFEISKKYNHKINIQIRNQNGLTALEVATAKLSPEIVAAILDYQADVSFFIFPASIHFHEYLSSRHQRKGELTLKILNVILHLENKGGYDLNKQDIKSIFQLFDDFELWTVTVSEECFHDDKVKDSLKLVHTKSGKSIEDLFKLSVDEASKHLDIEDVNNMTKKLCAFLGNGRFDKNAIQKIRLKFSIILLRKFLFNWIIVSFAKLIHNRLEIECIKKILINLSNIDFRNIYLAVGL